jgi:hypothetical protein
MTTLQTVLVTALIAIWLCISVGFLVSVIQSTIYDRKREKREKAQAARDLEYHEKRMADFK